MNVLLASVTERTREIGVRKATGARNRDLLAQFLAESVAIAGLGSVLGTLLGIAVSALVASIMRARTMAQVHAGFSVSTLLVAIAAPIIVGIAFGIYPALRAARLSPIDAIRHE
jgi:putative ABC transport system permease protein